MRKWFWLSIPLLFLVAGPALAATETVATFADPTSGKSGTFLFTYTDSSPDGILNGILNGTYLGTGLDLLIQGASNPDTEFTLTPLVGTGVLGFNGLSMIPVGGGTATVDFFNAGGDLLFIDFNVAHLTLTDVGSTDIVGDNVDIRFPASDPFDAPESFAFSFSNGTVLQGSLASILTGNEGELAWTAAFTSSAAVVPEPATILLLGSGLVGLGAVTRRRFRRGA